MQRVGFQGFAQSPTLTTRMPVMQVSPGTHVLMHSPFTAPGASFVGPPRVVMASPQQGAPVVVTSRGFSAGTVLPQARGPSYVAAPPPTVVFSSQMARGPSYVAPPPRGAVVVSSSTGPAASPGKVSAASQPVGLPAAAVMTYAPAQGATPAQQPTLMQQGHVVIARAVPAVVPASKAPEVKPAQSASVEYVAALEKRLADLEIIHASKTHSAFVFIKPHAVTDQVKRLVREQLSCAGICILDEGSISAESIDEQGLIDTHYGAIAAKAVQLKPSELVVQQHAKDKFQECFGPTWEEALEQGLVFNAADGAEAVGITPEELAGKWDGLQRDVDMIKFGGGFYCGKVDNVFVINGFYLDMRSKYTVPGSSIYYFLTEWDARSLSWLDFRGRVLGTTDPSTAAPNSLRNTIFSEWSNLGLTACPDTGDNGVHASASPFEAMAERANWLRMQIECDFFGRALLASGLPLSTIQEWCSDPIVTFDGKEQSLFDLLEDTNARECLSRASAIAGEN